MKLYLMVYYYMVHKLSFSDVQNATVLNHFSHIVNSMVVDRKHGDHEIVKIFKNSVILNKECLKNNVHF